MTDRKRPEVTESLPTLNTELSRVRVHEWSIEVVAGPDKGQRLTTLDSLVRIGTDSTNDLVLQDPTVSRRHAEIERTPRGFVVRDLGSRNGVFLDTHQVLQAFVDPGVKLSIGKTRVTLRREAKPTEVEVTSDDRFGELFGASDTMHAVFAVLRRIAQGDMSLLIEGETGTGKELAARAVHQHSGRRHGPFTVIDCNRLTESSVDRELAVPPGGKVPALFEQALGGTVFFDDVSELPASVQPKLLRLLDSRELDLRVIASSSKNVDEEVRKDRFRKDLYFRLAVARVRMPPLRSRKEELPRLAAHLVQHLRTQVELSAQTLALFEGYDWPGNVRELRNVLERGAVMAETGSTNWLDFLAQPSSGDGEATSANGAWATGASGSRNLLADLPYHQAKDRVLGDFERVYFAEVMKQAGFDIQLAEQKTGLSMQSLYRLLKKNGLRLKDLKNAEGLEK